MKKIERRLLFLMLFGLMMLTACSGLKKQKEEFGTSDKKELKTIILGNLEWIVLDEDENEYFLLSHYAIGVDYSGCGRDTEQQFNENGMKDNLWEKSYIRGWLDEEFYNDTFNDFEKDLIIESSVFTNDANEYKKRWGASGSQSTMDRVFLLSIQEVEKYLKGTDYLICQGVSYDVNSGEKELFDCNWWLRSPGENAEKNMYIDVNGEPAQESKLYSYHVRPAIRIAKYQQENTTDSPVVTDMPSSVLDVSSLFESSLTREVVVFGSYEQDNDFFNGKEPIEWEVLGEDNNGVLLISKYVLDIQRYGGEDDTWENCYLRNWLNNKFYNKAFSEDEKKRIKTVKLVNEDNPLNGNEGGNDTLDNVFCLSLSEIVKYYNYNSVLKDVYGSQDDCILYYYNEYLMIPPTAYTDGDRVFKMTDTEYENKYKSYNYSERAIGKLGVGWWLRSPSEFYANACVVNSAGVYGPYKGLGKRYGNGVRPAIYISR